MAEPDRVIVRDAEDGERMIIEMFMVAFGGAVFSGLLALTTWMGDRESPIRIVMWSAWLLTIPGWIGLFARIKRREGFTWGRFLLKGDEQRRAVWDIRDGLATAIKVSGRSPVWWVAVRWLWWAITGFAVAAIAGLFVA